MKTFVLAGVAAVAAITVPAIAAQQQAETRGQSMSRAAVEARIQTQFARVDTNRDGFVTQAEAQALRGQFRERRQALRAERRAERFARIDANRDGMLAREEFEARGASRGDRAERRESRPERRAERRERKAERRALRGARGLRLGAKAFARIDADRDGRVSLAEATAARLARFDRIDANRDGAVTREERRQARAARQARRDG